MIFGGALRGRGGRVRTRQSARHRMVRDPFRERLV